MNYKAETRIAYHHSSLPQHVKQSNLYHKMLYIQTKGALATHNETLSSLCQTSGDFLVTFRVDASMICVQPWKNEKGGLKVGPQLPNVHAFNHQERVQHLREKKKVSSFTAKTLHYHLHHFNLWPLISKKSYKIIMLVNKLKPHILHFSPTEVPKCNAIYFSISTNFISQPYMYTSRKRI